MANAPRWSDASGCTTAQRQPVVNAGGLVLSVPDRLLGRDRHSWPGRTAEHLVAILAIAGGSEYGTQSGGASS